MKTNDSSHYSPLNPIYDLPFDPNGGSGILMTVIWWHSDLLGDDLYVIKYLPYQWVETAANGLEISLERPEVYNATAIDEDINLALADEFKGKQYTINYITK